VFQHASYHAGDPLDLIVPQAGVHWNLHRLGRAAGAVGLGFHGAEQFHIGRHVDVQRFDVHAAPHAAHDELVALRAFRSDHAILIVDVRAIVGRQRQLDAGDPGQRPVDERGVRLRLSGPFVETLQRLEADDRLNVRETFRVPSAGEP